MVGSRDVPCTCGQGKVGLFYFTWSSGSLRRKCTGETWPPVTSHNFMVGLMFSTFKSKAMVLICWKYDKNMEELPLIISQMLWSTVKIDYEVETEKESKHFQMRNIKMSIFYTFLPFSHFIKEKCYYCIFYF